MIVTQESNPAYWQTLSSLWESEKRPGWVVIGSKTYQVVQNVAGEIEFHEKTTVNLYESTSFPT